MIMKNSLYLFLLTLILISCKTNDQKSDAYGNFEAGEIIISAQSAGQIKAFVITEGEKLLNNQLIGHIDSTDLALKRNQLTAQYHAVESKTETLKAQAEVFRKQKELLQKDIKRIEDMFREEAATQKQLDDIRGNDEVLEKQIKAVEIQNKGIASELLAIKSQIDQVNEAINKCKIINPVEGIVLEKYAEPGENTIPGKALYKIANVDILELKVYVSGSQLPSIKIGQSVDVFVDSTESGIRKLPGEISYISASAEFTPKIIQTREERINMVYAVKVMVKNDGSLKIGMPGEVNFTK